MEFISISSGDGKVWIQTQKQIFFFNCHSALHFLICNRRKFSCKISKSSSKLKKNGSSSVKTVSCAVLTYFGKVGNI